MRNKELLRLRVPVELDSEDAVRCVMESLFEGPVSIYTDVRLGRSWATVYLPEPTDWNPGRAAALRAGLRELAAAGVPRSAGRISVARLAAEDWAESWKRHFKPLVIGRQLLVLPSWSRRQPAPGQAVVVLDPGLSFGTGQHPTTRFCLEELVDAHAGSARARSLLDMGSGSGILAIAAARLGYERVEAFDFDPEAVRVAGANARLNGVRRRIRLSRQDLTRLPARPPGGKAGAFDVVCANLTSDLLVSESRRIASRVRTGGRLVLAGILASQFDAVREVFVHQGFVELRTCRKNEWQSGSFLAG